MMRSKAQALMTMNLGASETRHYGTHSKTFSVEQHFAPESKAEMMHCMVTLNSRLSMFFEDYEKNQLKGDVMSHPGTDENFKKPNALQTWYNVACLIVDIKDGKKYLKFKTREAKYAKFGITCYDEVVTEYNLNDLLGADLAWYPKGKEIKILVDTSTKNHKVVKIEGL